MMDLNKIYCGDSLEVLKTFPDNFIDCVITSPPYYALRDYGIDGQLGLEKTFHEYLNKLIEIFSEVKRVLKPTGTIWVNLGDSYSGAGSWNEWKEEWSSKTKQCKTPQANIQYSKLRDKSIIAKSLMNIPSRFAIKMTDELNLIQRNEIIWYKRNCMPSSVKDRFTVDFEKIYFFVKSKKYYFEQILEPYLGPLNRWAGNDLKADGTSNWDKGTGQSSYRNRNMRSNENGRNKRCVWDITTKPYTEAHFATFPEDLVKPMIQAGCPKEGIVLDIFAGSGTTLKVAKDMGRNYIGIELNPEYIKLAEKRLELDKLRLIA